jgi:hypothetical protein
MFWEVAGLERGPLSLVSKIEEKKERKSSGSGLEILLTTWYPLSSKFGTDFRQSVFAMSLED